MTDPSFERSVRSMLHESVPRDVPESMLVRARAIPQSPLPVGRPHWRWQLPTLAGIGAALVVTAVLATSMVFRGAVSDDPTPGSASAASLPASAPPSPSDPPPSATPSPSANPWLSEALISEAIQFRLRFGLRSDEAWVRTVAAMPDAETGIRAFGFPLTSDEVAVVERRSAVVPTVETYGASHPDAWAGVYIDSDRHVVALFTRDLPMHNAALRSLLGPEAPLVRGVEWTDAELQAVFGRIRDDVHQRKWLLAHDIYPLGVGVDTRANQVSVDVSSARTDLDKLLEARYDAVGMLTINSDGTGARLMPTGTLAGRVLDASGDPVAGVSIDLTSDVAGAGSHSETGSQTTDAEGRFEIPGVTAVTYDVLVYTFDEPDTKRVLGHAPATVRPDRTTTITIVIEVGTPTPSASDTQGHSSSTEAYV